MTDNTRTGTRRRLALGTATAALALTAGLAPGSIAVAGTTESAAGTASRVASNARPVDVLTRNLYLGADLGPVIASLTYDPRTWPPNVPPPPPVPVAAAQTWAAVQATNPPERMAAIADEIVEERPAAVGLQEVTRWTTYTFNPATGAVSNPTVVYDFLDLLLDALAERGVVYEEVAGATARNFESPPIPYLVSSTATVPTAAVQLLDRDVILRRGDVQVSNARTGQYTNILKFPVPDPRTGGVDLLPVKRGWGSVDVTTSKAAFRFVNSHLEAFGIPGVNAEDLRRAQVAELLAAQAAIPGDLPEVYVGDYNSEATAGPAYRDLVAGVGADAWLLTNRRDPGLTCCFDAAVGDEDAELSSRIDLVVVDDDVKALTTEVIGEEPRDMTDSGLWPSDHGGVVARLMFELSGG